MRRKFVIVGSIVIGVLLLTLLSVQLFVTFWITPVLNAVFKESVSYYSSGLYQVSYGEMEVSALQQKVSFKDFRLDFDSTRVQNEDSLRYGKWVSASVGDFELNLGNFWQMVPQRYLMVNELKIREPRLTIHNYSEGKNRKKDSVSLDKIQQFDAHALIKSYFDSLDVGVLNIQGANLKWINKVDEQLPFTIGDITANILDLHIDSSTVDRNYGYPYAREFVLQVENSSFVTEDSLYTFNIGLLKANPVAEELVIEAFSVTPQKSLYQFARDIGHQAIRMNLDIARINLQYIDLHYLVRDLALMVGKITIEDVGLSVFQDKRLPKAQPKQRPLVQEAILNIPIPFRLDTLELKRGNIQYQEHMPDAVETGKISFEDVYMSAYGITNLDSLVEKNTLMEADVRTRFMGSSWLDVHFDFPLNDPSQKHHISGEMYELPLEVMNGMLETTAFTSVRSGHAYAIKFDMDLNDRVSSGDVHFAYRDLKIELLNKEDPNDPKLREMVGSWVANLFVVKTDNPSSKSQSLRIGAISYGRDNTKSVFFYWWRSLLSGLKESMGLTNDDAPTSKNDAPESEPEEEEKDGFFKRLFKKKKADS
ncbi:hypothetical protein [Catalinimonas niigatensis]|uniref:hypothetical protein n=1 Tax=Catalinimonas niigatensis TaxID=1397264 RepID=UPI0026657F1B|nr:hypothetical protein [Catalinimonas niigatensis]WPP49553.1 hypothetical protein PZB72_23045 [Catalinimonas niigatensis]